MNNQTGFTLLELVIALAIFALLGLASWTLFDGVLRVQRSSMAHEREFRTLQRAVAVIERDLLHLHAERRAHGNGRDALAAHAHRGKTGGVGKKGSVCRLRSSFSPRDREAG